MQVEPGWVVAFSSLAINALLGGSLIPMNRRVGKIKELLIKSVRISDRHDERIKDLRKDVDDHLDDHKRKR